MSRTLTIELPLSVINAIQAAASAETAESQANIITPSVHAVVAAVREMVTPRMISATGYLTPTWQTAPGSSSLPPPLPPGSAVRMPPPPPPGSTINSIAESMARDALPLPARGGVPATRGRGRGARGHTLRGRGGWAPAPGLMYLPDADSIKAEHRLRLSHQIAKSPSIKGWISIRIDMKDGRAMCLRVQKSMTVDMIKRVLRAKVQIPKSQQRLLHGGFELRDAATVASAGIMHGSVLRMVSRAYGYGLPVIDPPRPYPQRPINTSTVSTIDVKSWDGKLLTVTIDHTTSILELKWKLCNITGTPVCIQRLSQLGDSMRDDQGVYACRRLADVAILSMHIGPCQHLAGGQADCEVHYPPPPVMFPIFVKIGNRPTLTLTVADSTTVRQLKQEVAKTTATPVCTQRVQFSSAFLYSDTRTLSSYGVNRESALTIFIVSCEHIGVPGAFCQLHGHITGQDLAREYNKNRQWRS